MERDDQARCHLEVEGSVAAHAHAAVVKSPLEACAADQVFWASGGVDIGYDSGADDLCASTPSSATVPRSTFIKATRCMLWQRRSSAPM
jgi:hypothetical protein